MMWAPKKRGDRGIKLREREREKRAIGIWELRERRDGQLANIREFNKQRVATC